MTGLLDILNCGAGHLAIRFEKDNPDEVVKARRIIQDMLRRGYTILVETEDGGTRRVKRFDPKRDEYIIEELAPAPAVKKGRGGYKTRRMAVGTTKATAVGRTGGG